MWDPHSSLHLRCCCCCFTPFSRTPWTHLTGGAINTFVSSRRAEFARHPHLKRCEHKHPPHTPPPSGRASNIPLNGRTHTHTHHTWLRDRSESALREKKNKTLCIIYFLLNWLPLQTPPAYRPLTDPWRYIPLRRACGEKAPPNHGHVFYGTPGHPTGFVSL